VKCDPTIHHRRSIRLPGHDYSQAGAYFVTFVTQQRLCMFGDVVHGEMSLNAAGEMAVTSWQDLPNRFPFVDLDEFVVMPNHMHGIIILDGTGACDDLCDRPCDHEDRPYDADGCRGEPCVRPDIRPGVLPSAVRDAPGPYTTGPSSTDACIPCLDGLTLPGDELAYARCMADIDDVFGGDLCAEAGELRIRPGVLYEGRGEYEIRPYDLPVQGDHKQGDHKDRPYAPPVQCHHKDRLHDMNGRTGEPCVRPSERPHGTLDGTLGRVVQA
jgi:hypothetical protein